MARIWLTKFIRYIIPLVFLELVCSNPVGPASYNWRAVVTYLGGQYTGEDVAVVGDALFFTLHGPGARATIRKYFNGQVTTVFVIDLKGASYAKVNDLSAAGNAAWAVGRREFFIGNGRGGWRLEPFIIKYDGVSWREIGLGGAFPPGELIGAAAVNTDICWLLFKEGTFGAFEEPTLWLYDKGTIKNFPNIKAACISYDVESGYIYALRAYGGATVFVSADGGITWREEKIQPPPPWQGFAPERISAYAAAGRLYVAATDTDGLPPAAVIYRRAGYPGAGRYEFLYYAPASPYSGGFNSIGGDERNRIIAVGYWASAYYDGSLWLQEELPNRNNFYDVTVAADGFYAIATDEQSNLQILYHP